MQIKHPMINNKRDYLILIYKKLYNELYSEIQKKKKKNV